MPWGVFAAALLLAYLAQTAVLGALNVQVVDLFLALTLICGLLMPTQEARLGAWIIGFLQDVGSSGSLGLHAVALGLTALVLTRTRGTVNQYFWGGRLVLGFLVSVPGQLLILLHQCFWQGAWLGSLWQMLGTALLISFIAAAAMTLLTQGLALLGWWDRSAARRFSSARRW